MTSNAMRYIEQILQRVEKPTLQTEETLFELRRELGVREWYAKMTGRVVE